MSDTDMELLARYTRQHAEDAFAEILRRHLGLVYSAALRQVRSPQLAEEVAQSVFIDLARSAARLKPETVLTAWLYKVTRRSAIDVVRREASRQLREQIATETNAMNATATDLSCRSPMETEWARIEPLLDEAMHALDDTDRAAVLLRYFENKSLREVGASLGTSENAAQKRLSRAVERLRAFFSKRGITVGASGLVVGISVNAVQAAPVGLIVSISTAAALVPTTLLTTATATAGNAIIMTTTQKVLVTAMLTAAVGTGIYEARQASLWHDQAHALQQGQAPLAQELARLKSANELLSNQVVQSSDSQALSKAQFNELLKLRGQAGAAQADLRDLAKMKSALAGQSGRTEQWTNAMAGGMEMAIKMRMTIAQTRLDLMKTTLALSDDQVRAIRELLQQQSRRQSEMALQAVSGKMTPEQRQAMAAEGGNLDDEIKALLTPGQLAAFPQFQQAEKTAGAEKSANYQASQVAGEFNLSKEQQDQIRAAFYQMHLNAPERGLNAEAITAARKSGNIEEILGKRVEQEKSLLEDQVKILGSVLSQEQLDTYRVQAMRNINMMAGAMKMLLPQKAAGTVN